MLVISRKRGERLLIGDDIVIMITKVRGGKVSLGITAPSTIDIKREELVDKPLPQEPVAAEG